MKETTEASKKKAVIEGLCNKSDIIKWLCIEFVSEIIILPLSLWNKDYLSCPVSDGEFMLRTFINLITSVVPFVIMIICFVKVCKSNSKLYKLVNTKLKYLNIAIVIFSLFLGSGLDALCFLLAKTLYSIEELYFEIAIVFCILSLIINLLLTKLVRSEKIKIIDYSEYCKTMRDVPEKDKLIIKKQKELLREKYSNIAPETMDECESLMGQPETLGFVLNARSELFRLTKAEISDLLYDYSKPLYFEYQIKAAPPEILSKCKKYTEERKTDKLKKFLSKNEQLDAKCKAILINYYCENASGVLTPSANSSKIVPNSDFEISDIALSPMVLENNSEEKTVNDFVKSNIICRSCGAALLENATFCNKCGAKYVDENETKAENEERPFCRKCGERLFLDSDFCHKCGTKIIK